MAQPESHDADAPVIEAIRAGDRYAFAELVRRHHGWVRGVVYGVLGNRDGVDDVVQQVWTACWQRIGELREADRWRTWLYRLARNAAIDAGREASRRKRRQQTMVEGMPLTIGDGPKPDTAGDQERSEVLAAVQSLPAMYREPFVLRHLNGWSYNEIAEVMGMPVDSVETRLVRARRFLREWLTDRMR